MPFKGLSMLSRLKQSHPWRVFWMAVAWAVAISAAHYAFNTDHEQRPTVRMGYMPVITNLAAPLLDAASVPQTAPVRFRAVKFSSFAEMAEALRGGNIQAAFIIAPLSIVLHQQGADVRVVYIGNRHESTFVVRKDLAVRTLNDLDGRSVAVPMRFSGHHLALLRMMRDAGTASGLRIVEMNPPDMASAMAAGALDGYLVGEPFAAQSIESGDGEVLTYLEDVWPGFICNLLLVNQQFIDAHPELVQALVQGAVRSGLWARDHLQDAAGIAARYWGQPVDLVEFAMTTPAGRVVFDQYRPRREEMQALADLMLEFGLSHSARIEGLVEDRFARGIDLSGIDQLQDILKPPTP